MYLDPILVEHARKTADLRITERTRITSVEDLGDKVIVKGTNVGTGEEFAAEAEFVIGCDGTSSLVRKTIGATLSGDEVVQHTETVLFRSPVVLDSIDGPAGWQLHFLNPRQSGSLICIDGKGTWLANIGLPAGAEPSDEVTRVQKVRDILDLGAVDEVYDRKLVLSRPDRHVGWRGNEVPADARGLIDLVRGAAVNS